MNRETPCTEAHRQLARRMVLEEWDVLRDELERKGREHFDAYDYYALIMSTYKTGDWKQAVVLGREGHQRFPSDPGIVDRMAIPMLRGSRFRQVIDLWRNERPVLAGESFSEAMANLVGNVMVAYGQLERPREGITAVRDELPRWSSPLMAGNAACLFALAGDSDAALLWIRKALDLGKAKEFFLADPDFDAVRHLPEFVALLEKAPSSESVAVLNVMTHLGAATTLSALTWIIHRRDLLAGSR